MNNSRQRDIKPVAPQNEAPNSRRAQSPYQVQAIFVLTLLFIVLSVMGEYILGSFIGLNIGEDFALILGGAIVSGICVGMVIGVLHYRNGDSARR